jgi:hypothetical protein
MNDERIERALREMGGKRLPASADNAIRARIEEEWSAISPRGGTRWPVQLLVAAAAIAMTLGLGSAALGAPADSALWPARVALEDFGLQLRVTAEARADYLLDLIDARTTEAARQEAAGHALAAGKALAAREDALKHLSTVATKNEPPRTIPPLPGVFASPVASPTPEPPRTTEPPRSPEPARTPDRTPEPTRSPEPTQTLGLPAVTPFRTPEITHSPLPPQTVPPTATVVAIKIYGTVRYEDGTVPLKACITTSSNVPTTIGACSLFAENGVFTATFTVAPGGTVRLYAYASERGLYGGSEAAVLTAPLTTFPPITLHAIPTPTTPPATPPPSQKPSTSALPTATPVSTGEYFFITGTVRYDDGTIPAKACITTSPTLPTTCAGFAENGTYSIKVFVASLAPGQTVRLYAHSTERGLYSGSEIATLVSPVTTYPPITLRPQ